MTEFDVKAALRGLDQRYALGPACYAEMCVLVRRAQRQARQAVKDAAVEELRLRKRKNADRVQNWRMQKKGLARPAGVNQCDSTL